MNVFHTIRLSIRPVLRRALPLGLATSLLVLAACGSGEEGPQPKAETTPATRAIPVLVATVQPTPMTDVLTLPGQTEALHDVLVAAERAGRVEWVGPSEGDFVTAGQVLAKIDLAQAEADLSKARSAFELARKQTERRSALLQQKVVSKEELDKAETELSSARSDLTQAQVAFDQGRVLSPINGRINDLLVDPGEYVNTGSPVAELVDVSKIRINLNAPELDVRYLSVGQEVDVRVDAYPDETWKGVVDFVAFKADESTKTFRTRVVVDNPEGRIRPGMLARVQLKRQQLDNAVAAPLFAIVDKGGERIIFVEEDGVARARTIEIGVIDGEKAQILKGLSLGEKLIVAGFNEVEEGVAVEPSTVGAQAQSERNSTLESNEAQAQ